MICKYNGQLNYFAVEHVRFIPVNCDGSYYSSIINDKTKRGNMGRKRHGGDDKNYKILI